MTKSTTNYPLSDDKSINFKLESFCHNLEKESAKNIEYLIRSFCNTPEEERDFIASLQINNLKTFEDLLIRLTELQKERIKRLLDLNKKTIAIYFPSCAYREHLGDIANKLRNKGHNVLTFIGTVCEDKYEKEKNVFYAGHGIVGIMDFVDIFILPTMMKGLPEKAKKVQFVHDIWDSPGGPAMTPRKASDGGTPLTPILLEEIDYILLPSTAVMYRENDMHFYRRKKPLCRIPGGYVKLDSNLRYFENSKLPIDSIIYAPTVIDGDFINYVSLPEYGPKIIGALLNNISDYKIIFRPHPHTLNTKYVKNIVKRFSDNAKFVFDFTPSFYMDNYSRSRLMVTDVSGTAFTYAFTTLRPVIFFSHNERYVNQTLNTKRYFKDRNKIGYIATNITELVEKVKLELEHVDRLKESIRKFRDSTMFNIGKVEDYFVENFHYIVEDKKNIEWQYINPSIPPRRKLLNLLEKIYNKIVTL